jgi:hypothetical protein
MTCVSFGLPVEDWYWQGEVEARVVASAPIEFTRGKGEIDSGALTYAMFQGESVQLFSTSGAAKKCDFKCRTLSVLEAAPHVSHPVLAWARETTR